MNESGKWIELNDNNYPGIISLPWISVEKFIPFAPGNDIDAYDIIKVKEFVRRRKLMSQYNGLVISKWCDTHLTVSSRSVGNETIIDVSAMPKMPVKHMDMKIEILPTGAEFKL